MLKYVGILNKYENKQRSSDIPKIISNPRNFFQSSRFCYCPVYRYFKLVLVLIFKFAFQHRHFPYLVPKVFWNMLTSIRNLVCFLPRESISDFLSSNVTSIRANLSATLFERADIWNIHSFSRFINQSYDCTREGLLAKQVSSLHIVC